MRKSGIKPKKVKKILYYPKKGYKNAIRILKLLSNEEKLSTNQIGIKLSPSGEVSHRQIKDKMEYLTTLGYCSEYRTVRNSDHVCENCNESTRYFVEAKYLEGDIETMKNWPVEKQKEDHIIGQLLGFDCFNCGKYLKGHKTEYYKIQQDRFWSLSNNGKVVMLGILSGQKLYNFIEKQTNIIEFELINCLVHSERKDLFDRLIGIIKKNMDVDSNAMKYLESWYDEMKTEIYIMKIDEKRNIDLANFIEKHRFELQMYYADRLNKRR